MIGTADLALTDSQRSTGKGLAGLAGLALIKNVQTANADLCDGLLNESAFWRFRRWIRFARSRAQSSLARHPGLRHQVC